MPRATEASFMPLGIKSTDNTAGAYRLIASFAYRSKQLVEVLFAVWHPVFALEYAGFQLLRAAAIGASEALGMPQFTQRFQSAFDYRLSTLGALFTEQLSKVSSAVRLAVL